MEQQIVSCDTCQRQTLLCVGGTNENKCDEMVAKCPMCVCHGGSCYDKKTKKNCDACPGYMKCLNEVLQCSTEQIEIHEDETLGLKCNIKFLASIEEEIEYVYDKRINFRIHPLKVDSEPYFVKHYATSQDSGHYTCTARSKESKFPFAKADFIVKVVESESRSMHLHHPDIEVLPTVLSGDIKEEDGDDDEFYTSILIAVVYAAILIMVMCAFAIILMIRKKRLKDIKEVANHMKDIKRTHTIVNIMTSLIEEDELKLNVDQTVLSNNQSSGK
ncbi:hypothetical protein XELAEV_18035820mg [Xenopus laevis]|uniref:Ig-like domain-containing protein n=1 Tax=Xenopus laevis TaxID=8355 RepID=A0A974HCX0_XENLA|nr:hypothetical protein XELAEV_18035820mg [Xenopus laevis]